MNKRKSRAHTHPAVESSGHLDNDEIERPGRPVAREAFQRDDERARAIELLAVIALGGERDDVHAVVRAAVRARRRLDAKGERRDGRARERAGARLEQHERAKRRTVGGVDPFSRARRARADHVAPLLARRL